MGVAEARLLSGAAVSYALAWVLLGASFRSRVVRGTACIRWLLVGGLGLHAGAITTRWASIGHPPLFGSFETAVAGAWFIVLVTLLLLWRAPGLAPLALVTVPVALLIEGHGLLFPTKAYPLTISEQSLWVTFHALVGWAALASYSAACAFAVSLLAGHRGKRADLAPLDILDENLFRYLMLGFVAQSILITSGAYYSFLLFGRWWRWDPVESLSLISWLLYGLTIHLRLFFGWRARRGAWVAIACTGVLILTYKLVPSLPPGSTYHVFDLRFP